MKLNFYKKLLGCLSLLALFGLNASTVNAQTLYELNFDSPATNAGYVASFLGNDGATSTDYCDTSQTGFGGTYTGSTGTFFAAMDIDGVAGAPSARWTMDIAGIDISSATSLSFSIDLAEDDDGTNQDWDFAGSGPDSFLIIATIDGGTPDTLLYIGAPGPGDFNQEPEVLASSDAALIGMVLTESFTTFSGNFAGTGSSLDILIVANLQSGDEDIAFDNFKISGGAAATCSMTDIAVFNFQCDNNGTASDPSDDFWNIGIEPTISNPGASNKFDVVFSGSAANPAPDTATYGTNAAFFTTAPGSAGGGNFDITARDIDDSACQFTVTFDDTANGGSCSTDPAPSTPANVMVHAEDGDVYVENLDYGVIIKSPNGTCYRITVADDGTLSTEAVTCP